MILSWRISFNPPNYPPHRLTSTESASACPSHTTCEADSPELWRWCRTADTWRRTSSRGNVGWPRTAAWCQSKFNGQGERSRISLICSDPSTGLGRSRKTLPWQRWYGRHVISTLHSEEVHFVRWKEACKQEPEAVEKQSGAGSRVERRRKIRPAKPDEFPVMQQGLLANQG